MNISSSTSFSALQRPDSATLFKQTDANGDGKITQEELTSALETRAQKTGGDQGPSAEDLFTQLDADGDGEITEAEHEAGLAGMENQGGLRPAPSASAEASGLVDVLTPLLEQLAELQESEDASSTEAVDTQSSIDELIEQLVAELKKHGASSSVFKAEA